MVPIAETNARISDEVDALWIAEFNLGNELMLPIWCRDDIETIETPLKRALGKDNRPIMLYFPKDINLIFFFEQGGQQFLFNIQE